VLRTIRHDSQNPAAGRAKCPGTPLATFLVVARERSIERIGEPIS